MLRAGIIFFGWLMVWQALLWVTHWPIYILPSPMDVLSSLIHLHRAILSAAMVTISETALGFVYGVVLGSFMAVMMILMKPVRLWMWPILLVSQAIPTFSIAPIIVMWIGYGMASKIFISAMMIFFPVTSSLYDGLSQTPRNMMDLAQVMHATKWRLLWHLQFPASFLKWATGIRIAAAFAPMGAIVGEWLGASNGLGFLMLSANAQLDMSGVFACLAILVIFSLAFYFSIDLLLKKMWEV